MFFWNGLGSDGFVEGLRARTDVPGLGCVDGARKVCTLCVGAFSLDDERLFCQISSAVAGLGIPARVHIYIWQPSGPEAV